MSGYALAAAAADRFAFQRACCARVAGRILNVGCREDPARLKATFGPDRVTNLDRFTTAEGEHTPDYGLPIPVDVVHDMTSIPWPFADDTFDLVVCGDVLEDLPPGAQPAVLREANRVARHLCITAPEDSPERDAHHLTTITHLLLLRWLAGAGWTKVEVRVVPYGFVPLGYFVWAERG